MAMKSLLSAIALVGMLACGLGCAKQPQTDSSCPEGEEGCPCVAGLCNDPGLYCPSQTCVRVPSSSGGSSGGSSSSAVASGGQGGNKSSSSSSASSKPLPTPPSPNCTDVSTDESLQATQSGVTVVDVEGKDKNYFFQANWWKTGAYNKQTEDQVGLSFTVANPANAGSPDNDPAGYPSFYIGGSYSGRSATKGSNLPKQVSALASVNTVLSTNANSKGRSNYNVAYDVWFTATSAALDKTQYNPGAGGAYMMVWFFMPSDRQPRGQKRMSGKPVNGIPGTTWDVWIDSTNPPCISYVNTAGVETLDYDLNKFIQDSVSSNYGITNSMYLYLIFGGFEIWRGGDGLQMKAFCADVK
jgi:hypothetical protein